jgi:hypothetical protein
MFRIAKSLPNMWKQYSTLVWQHLWFFLAFSRRTPPCAGRRHVLPRYFGLLTFEFYIIELFFNMRKKGWTV